MIKLVEENIGENLCDLGFGDKFLSATTKLQPVKRRPQTTVS